MVVLQVLGTSAIIAGLALYWCRFMPCSYEFSAISSSRDEEMSRGIEEMEAELNAGGMQENARFSDGMQEAELNAGETKNSRRFLKDCGNFAIIAKITVHSEILNFRYASYFRYDREIYYA